MKITMLNGSPRKENTAAMVEDFKEGAEAAGHVVDILHVGRMKIAGCLGCKYCHGKGEGKCIQKDDMGKVIGRSGRIAKAIRAVVKAAATKTEKHVNVDILDEEEG